ncbi:pogo transposable [Pyrenophora seminiperda CCB06]|uniref:Pogo transposable n=1 Tax=Pyrenophora seminiperda CCB06 TaxID=1302712 RepID=A0A3M7MGU0_9PLEO|nr:pogo transposable [Pyrenophora seminiperda CCB06]
MLYKKQQADAAKLARQHAAEERREAKKVRAAELAADRALRKLQRDTATAQKSHDTLNRPKRKASHKVGQNPTKRRRVVAARSRDDAAPAPPSPPRKTTRTRSIQLPRDILGS